jgi:glycosyltransferase involved in cell wall biosynthesis
MASTGDGPLVDRSPAAARWSHAAPAMTDRPRQERAPRCSAPCDAGGSDRRRVLLISNRVMHYRVSVYNYFWRRFQAHGWEFIVTSSELQQQNQQRCDFPFQLLPFQFARYRDHIRQVAPDAVVLFLHLKDTILWPLVHWLKWRGLPVAVWTKARNLDDPDNPFRNMFFDYLHEIADGLILYTGSLNRFVSARHRNKTFVANNTVNFEDFPEICESKEQIKAELGIPFEKVVLFSGRIGEEQNRKKVDHLIEIFRTLDRPDVGLVIVGSGLSDEWRQRMNPANTRYLGEVHDPGNVQISRIFKMADICSIPGHVGLGLNQAFYWGLPMVTEDGRQPPEIEYLRNGENGFIVPENDVDALRAQIVHLITDDADRRRLSANARRDIMANASIEGMFQGFLNCVEFMAHGRVNSGVDESAADRAVI